VSPPPGPSFSRGVASPRKSKVPPSNWTIVLGLSGELRLIVNGTSPSKPIGGRIVTSPAAAAARGSSNTEVPSGLETSGGIGLALTRTSHPVGTRPK
jgi:hypothetical protein